MHINPIAKLLSIGAVAAAGLLSGGVAEARSRPQVDFTGTGTYEMVEFDVFARGTTDAYGRPFDGQATFMLSTDDGTLPGPGECEPGGANFALTGRKRQELWGVSLGDICGHWVQEPTSIVTHVFTGQYSIAESKPRLRDTEGWIEIRLATGNRASITLFDS
jgi:hypothetical protein